MQQKQRKFNKSSRNAVFYFSAVWSYSNGCWYRRWDGGCRGRTWREINSASCEEQLHQLLPNSWNCCHRMVHHPTLCEGPCDCMWRGETCAGASGHTFVSAAEISSHPCVCVRERQKERECMEVGGGERDLHLAKLIVWAWNCLTSPQSSAAKSHTIGCFQLQPDNSIGITQREGEGRGRRGHGRHIHWTERRKDANRQLDGRRAERRRARPP